MSKPTIAWYYYVIYIHAVNRTAWDPASYPTGRYVPTERNLDVTKHDIYDTGMDRAAGSELAAAVTNAGGLGVVGGYGFTPNGIRSLVSGTSLRTVRDCLMIMRRSLN